MGSATDKEDVKNSIVARLHSSSAGVYEFSRYPKSSKDLEIDAIIQKFKNLPRTSENVLDEFEKVGGKRRRTRKSTQKSRKSRKYSRRR
jgi:hypothetical protein